MTIARQHPTGGEQRLTERGSRGHLPVESDLVPHTATLQRLDDRRAHDPSSVSTAALPKAAGVGGFALAALADSRRRRRRRRGG